MRQWPFIGKEVIRRAWPQRVADREHCDEADNTVSYQPENPADDVSPIVTQPRR
jgi:hypothetical protein